MNFLFFTLADASLFSILCNFLPFNLGTHPLIPPSLPSFLLKNGGEHDSKHLSYKTLNHQSQGILKDVGCLHWYNLETVGQEHYL